MEQLTSYLTIGGWRNDWQQTRMDLSSLVQKLYKTPVNDNQSNHRIESSDELLVTGSIFAASGIGGLVCAYKYDYDAQSFGAMAFLAAGGLLLAYLGYQNHRR